MNVDLFGSPSHLIILTRKVDLPAEQGVRI